MATAAYALVAESGIDNLTLRAVARRLGATTGLVSHHFADRADLISAALDHAAATMLARALSVPDGAGPVEMLAAVLPTSEESTTAWRFSLSVRTAGLFDDELRQFDQVIREHWAGSLPRQLEAITPGDPIEATRHLVALVDGIALQALLDPDGWPPERQLAHLRLGFDTITTTTVAAATGASR